MKRSELTAGTAYAKAGNNYPSPWADVRKVTVVDTGSWWMEKNSHRWQTGHYGKLETYTTETGETFEAWTCCLGKDRVGHIYSTKGVLVRDAYDVFTVIPVNLIRDTWANYEAMEAARKERRVQAQAAAKVRMEQNIATRKHLAELVETYGIPGTLSGGDEYAGLAGANEPTLKLTAAEVEKVAATYADLVGALKVLDRWGERIATKETSK